MHLIWENLVPNLVSLWTGKFKGLDTGSGSYQLPGTVWEAIGEATASAGDTLPSVFGPRLGNISQDRSACTADAWSLWTLYISPVILRSQFAHSRYYRHFVSLVELLHLCLQFEVSRDDIQRIRDGFASWVEKYEEYYYQYSPDRLSTCPVTVHALLHIADGIEASGPVWASWAFPMERFCGELQPGIKSRRHPWASIDRRIQARIQLSHLKVKYNLFQELDLRPPRTATKDMLRRDDTCVLMPPHRYLAPEKGLLDKVIGSLVTRFECSVQAVRSVLPRELDQWGKVRILNDGDTIHTASLTMRHADKRDQTHVRYEVFVDKHQRRRKRQPVYELQTFYGRLEYIFALRFETVEALTALGLDRPTSVILAAIKPCVVTHSHPRLDIHYSSQYGALSLIDIQCIQCVIGRVQSPEKKGLWGIVDRSGALSRALVVDDSN
ncbi:hypothetical protein C2E23DRAFT_721145 [Lenzites betulinus]|nr:hypothetical protein C2E23DRAFT_721145 [Lenzites betulinus]